MKIMLYILMLTLSICNANAEENNPLLGSWKSNKEMSIRHGVNHDSPRKKQINAYKKLLGKLIITFTENEFITNLEGHIDKEKYKFVSQKDNLIVIKIGDIEYEWVIEGNSTIYQKLGGVNTNSAITREYFTRQ